MGPKKMLKSVLFILVLIALVSAKELEKESGETAEFPVENDKEAAKNLEEEDHQDATQTDTVPDDQSSDPFISDVAQWVDDDDDTKEKELEGLIKEQESDNSDPTDVQDTDAPEDEANVNQVENEEQEKQNDEAIAKEVKVVQRGWRRRRRRRRRPPPPPPPPPPVRICAGSIRYDPRTHSCCFNKFTRPKGRCPVFRCGRATYNPYIHRCCYGRLHPRSSRCPVHRCGHYRFNPRFQSCCPRGRRYRVYNRYTHKCCYGIPIAKCYPCHRWGVCGWRLYSTWIYRCCAHHLLYSHHFQKCCHGRVIDKEALCFPNRGK